MWGLETLWCDPRVGGRQTIPSCSQAVSISEIVQPAFGFSFIFASIFDCGSIATSGGGVSLTGSTLDCFRTEACPTRRRTYTDERAGQSSTSVTISLSRWS